MFNSVYSVKWHGNNRNTESGRHAHKNPHLQGKLTGLSTSMTNIFFPFKLTETPNCEKRISD